LGISEVKSYSGDYLITVENDGQIPMPVQLQVIYDDNSKEEISLPVEIWQRGNSWTHLLKTTKQVQRVVLDPNKMLPDVNVLNDTWNKL
jgi:hypothetical protein